MGSISMTSAVLNASTAEAPQPFLWDQLQDNDRAYKDYLGLEHLLSTGSNSSCPLQAAQ